jgi:hypothetical protein
MAQTQTAVQEHKVVVELEDGDSGYRWWSGPMTDAEASAYLAAAEARGDYLSEWSCATGCAECLNP